jgi:antigen flippase
MAEASKDSYREILHSTSIIGLSSVINIVLSIARTKIFAILLGPSGIGLLGVYNGILSTAVGLAGMGLEYSGTRQVAEAQSSDNGQVIVDVRVALWRTGVGLGIGGGILLFLLRYQLAGWTLGSEKYATGVGLLSVGVLATVLMNSQKALLNGLRLISRIAAANIVGAAVGTIISIVLILLFAERAIPLSVVALALAALGASAWYVNRIPAPSRMPSLDGQRKQIVNLLRLGIAVMSAGILSSFTLLIIRSMVVKTMGLDAAGYFQASWGITVTYIGIVLGAMGTDFYPRLTAAVGEPGLANRIVNEQARVALLLSGPLLLGMLAFAPLAIKFFYTPQFEATIPIFRWQVIGNIFKVAAFPMTYLLLARGLGRLYFFSELTWNVVFLLITWVSLPYCGLIATGIAFLGAYLAYFVMLNIVTFQVSSFRWQPHVLLLLATSILILGIAMSLGWWSSPAALVVGGALTVGFALYSLRSLYIPTASSPIKAILSRPPFSLQ